MNSLYFNTFTISYVNMGFVDASNTLLLGYIMKDS